MASQVSKMESYGVVLSLAKEVLTDNKSIGVPPVSERLFYSDGRTWTTLKGPVPCCLYMGSEALEPALSFSGGTCLYSERLSAASCERLV